MGNIRGLKGLGDLSHSEQNAWINMQIKAGILPKDWTQNQAQQLYRNKQFLELGLGNLSDYTPSQRDSMIMHKLLTNEVVNKFNNASPESIDKISNLSDDGLYDLLNSDYKTPDELRKDNSVIDIKEAKDKFNAQVDINNEGKPVKAILDKTFSDREKYKDFSNWDYIKVTFSLNPFRQNEDKNIDKKANKVIQKNENVLDKIVAKDLDKTIDKNKDTIENVKNQYLNSGITVDDVTKQLDAKLGKHSTTINTPDGELQIPIQGSDYYNIFKDRNQLNIRNFTFDDRVRINAMYDVFASQFGEQKASELVNQEIRNIINKNNNIWDYIGDSGKAVGAKAASSMAQKMIGFELTADLIGGTTKKAWDSIFGTDEENPQYYKSYYNIMNGINGRTGDKRNNLFDLNYWNDVYQFNAFDQNLIDNIKEHNGISPNQKVTAFGKDYNISKMLQESIGQMGNLLPTVLDVAITRGLGAAASSISTNAVSKLGTAAGATLGAIANTTSIANRFTAGLPEMTMEAKIAYDEVINKAEQAWQNKTQKDADLYADNNINSELNQKLINDYMNRQIEEEVERQYNQQFVNNNSENPVYISKEDIKQQLLSNKEVMSNLKEFATESLKAKIANDYVQNAPDLDREELTKRALGAGALNFMIFGVRDAIDNFTFKSFLFDKGTRASKLLDTFDISVSRTAEEAKQINKRLRMAVALSEGAIGGGISEYLDSLSEGFSEGFHLNKFNNRTNGKYTAEEYVEGNKFNSNFLANFTAGWQDLAETSKTKDAWFEAGIGALGGLINLSPSLEGIFIPKEVKATMSKLEKLNLWVNNPLFSSYLNEKKAQEELDKNIEAYNKEVKKHKDTYQHVGTFLSKLKNMYDSESEIERKDEKAKLAYELISSLMDMKGDQLGNRNEYVRQAISTIEELSKGNTKSEQVQKAIQEYLTDPENQDIANNQDKEQIALERLQSNAKQLQTMMDTYQKVQKKLDSTGLTKKYSSDYANQLLFELTMSKNWEDRLSQIEESLTGNNKWSTTDNTSNIQFSKANATLQIEQIDKKIQKRKEEVEKLKQNTELKEKVKNFRIENQEKEIDKLETQKDSILKSIESFDDKKILSKEEILNLNPKDRAFVFANKTKYKKEQQQIIEELETELKKENPEVLQVIKDAGELYERLKLNDESYNSMISNPEIFDMYAISQIAFRDSYAKIQRYTNALADFDVATTDMSKDEIVNYVVDNAVSSDLVKDLVKMHPEREEDLKDILATIKLQEDLDNVLNDLPSNEQATLKPIIADTVRSAKTVEEAMSKLEDLINIQTSDAAKERLESIVEKTEKLGYQRDATKVRDRQKEIEEKKKEQERKEKAEAKKNGDNYGWNGYKVGDIVYMKDSDGSIRKGTVAKFQEKDIMYVQWGSNRNITYRYSASNSLNNFSKNEEDLKISQQNEEKEQPESESVDITKEIQDINNPISQNDSVQEKLDKTGEVNSPSAEEQVASSTNPDVALDTPVTSDPTDGGNNFQENNNSLIGNLFYRYLVQPLKESGILQMRKPKSENDTMSQFFKFLDNNSIQLQEIIDNELGTILKNNPDIHLKMMLRKPTGSTRTDAIQNLVMLVIDYIDDIAKIHDKDRGGIITANNKQYLLVGTLGFDDKIQEEMFKSTTSILRNKRESYFKENPNEIYYVDPTFYTQVKEMTSGRIVRQLEDDEEVKSRKISELLSDKKRHNKPLKLENLKWWIQVDDENRKVIKINWKPNDKWYPPIDSGGNIGNTFLMIEAANGSYIPVYINPIMYNELQNNELKTAIDDLLTKCTSTNLETRKNAVLELRNLLSLNDNNNIIVGIKDTDNITVKKDGKTIFKSEVGKNFNRNEFLKAIESVNFRINITESSLSNKAMLKILDDAGVLTTDVAKLGTSNASYIVYPCDNTGKPIKIEPTQPKSEESTDTNFKRKYTDSVLLDGTVYRKKDEGWEDNLSNPITDNETIVKLEYLRWVKMSKAEPVLVENGIKYYTVTTQKGNKVSFGITRNGNITFYEPERIERMVEQNNQRIAEQEAKQRAAEALDNIQDDNNIRVVESENIDFDDETPTPQEGSTKSTEDLMNQNLGIEEEKSDDISNDNQKDQDKITQEVIKDTIKSNNDDVNEPPKKSLEDLQNQNKLDNFTAIYRDRTYRSQLNTIVKEKGWNWGSTLAEHEAFLKKNNISTVGITNIDSWLDMIKNCK